MESSADHRRVKEAHCSEEEFYRSYDWCLNPLPRFRNLFFRLRETMARLEISDSEWQKTEYRINIWMFVCAIGCTVDDFLSCQCLDLGALASRFPILRPGVALGQFALRSWHSLRMRTADRRLRTWRTAWDRVIERACVMLLNPGQAEAMARDSFRATVENLLGARLPANLLETRITLLEGLRSQDLSHYDVVAMADLFLARFPVQDKPLLVIGPRTAGAYFAPLVKACLECQGWRDVSWLSIRPKVGLAHREMRRLRQSVAHQVRVLVVDDHPNTGRTFGLIAGALNCLGVAPENIVLMAPSHPKRTDWRLPEGTPGSDQITILRLEPAAFHKAQLLEPTAFQAMLRPLARDCGWTDCLVLNNPSVDLVNAQFRERYTEGFHVRLKRLFEVQFLGNNGQSERGFVLAKGTGWGWLSYHSYIVGKRLEGFGPPVVGLRQGLLVTRWLGIPGTAPQRAEAASIQEAVPLYVAARVRLLALDEDPCLDDFEKGHTGWTVLSDTLRNVYGRFAGRLKRPALHKALRQYRAPRPTLVDGKLAPEEWIAGPDGLHKVDIEHHGFGSTEMNVVDPAYDLASAIFEFGLSRKAEANLLRTFAKLTGDQEVDSRINLYKLVYGLRVMNHNLYEIAFDPEGRMIQHWNRRYIQARDFLISQTNHICADRLTKPDRVQWTRHLFFLDVDGVLDRDLLGFPHTTACGVRALSLLLNHGVSVVLNTARSIGHVRSYCAAYGLQGGVGELGAVFWNAVRGQETALVDEASAEQLRSCRREIVAIPGVFVDPDYQYIVRAYRFHRRGTAGLPCAEIEAFLNQRGFDGLSCVATPVETYIAPKNRGKGTGLQAVRRLVADDTVPVAAIGDTIIDVPMLEAAEFGYAPSNCSRPIRALAEQGRCRIMPHPFQRGLLAAGSDAIRRWRLPEKQNGGGPTRLQSQDDLLWALMKVADRSKIRQWLATASFRRL